MATRYEIRQDNEGWTVYNIFTGQPARVRDIPQTGLQIQDADDLADLLTLAERKHNDLHRELTR